MYNKKFAAMFTLEGRRNDDTLGTREAEQVLIAAGWTPAMIKVWRRRNVRRDRRARN